MDACKVLVADDHPLFRAALALALRELNPRLEIVEAHSFASVEEAVAAHADLELALLDLSMPGAMGLSALVYLRGERPQLPVVVVSANDHPRTVRRAQQFGAAGFISKSAPLPQMRQAIAAVMDGAEWFPADKSGKSEEDERLAAKLAQLTPQQFRVLMYVADGLLNKQIAYRLGATENTVKVHVTALLRKLECHGRTQLAVLVKGLESGAAAEETDSGA